MVYDELLQHALSLPTAGRARLVRALLSSLESGARDVDADELWAAEIERRLSNSERADASARDWRAVIESIRRSLGDAPRH